MTIDQLQARKITITGRVQGVGFRPFVSRLAHQHNLSGWVRNRAGQVEIWVQGSLKNLALFEQQLISNAPPLAKPDHPVTQIVTGVDFDTFIILPSVAGDVSQAHIPPDYFTCDDCLAEMRDKTQRRYRYPFINCTQCGPRYTLIKQLPYDRPNTSMADFPLCSECRKDYENPLDRRFHAQPLACPACGPTLAFHRPGSADINDNEAAIKATVAALQAGLIVAVKGIGGYHLLCSATSEAVVLTLRLRKQRRFKPLAVMLPWSGDDGLDQVRHYTKTSATELTQLTDQSRPIVLIKKCLNADLAESVAPEMHELGIMLPYSPLHHLLLQDYGAPLIATSANISGEPVLTEAEQVESRLGLIADAFLHHNRPILRPADDSVYKVIGGSARAIRVGRGMAPLEFTLPFSLACPLLAVGGQMKNTIALAWDQRVVISPHIGDLGSPRSQQVFEQTIADLTRLYGLTVKQCVCDAHPDYSASRWAERSGFSVHKVFHHHAHAAALAAEHQIAETMLVFTWDGTGFGEDGTIWGGEGLLGKPGDWRRVSSFKPYRLPGGEKAGREPWRSALALCWQQGDEWPECPVETGLLKQTWQKQINCPLSSSVGRLFDAAAALTGIVQQADFDGHAPMWLEAAGSGIASAGIDLPLTCNRDGLWLSDWAPLLSMLQNQHLTLSKRSSCFHASLAMALVKQAKQIQTEHQFINVGLTGGVFQNRLLTDYVTLLLQAEGFTVCLPKQLPGNDAGISFGQIIEAGSYLTKAR
ncbi:carbamoyltransferase HypF [Methylobacter psychrophilus]|uniref:carbamoyltransferase HypF n=1 Tax=Methylobacter psychrophilus TaxID=96941 RepID=UPI0021D51052|nr:carbamoyltransferase HypF [Methylobacter psychrophilus]